MALENKAGYWNFQSIQWIVPKEGESGKIQDVQSSKVLTFRANSNSEVTLETFDGSVDQIWQRTYAKDGYFELRRDRENILSLVNDTYTTVEGKYSASDLY